MKDYVKIYKYQQGGAMPMEQAPASPEQDMMATIQQIIANQDCAGAMEVLSMMLQQTAQPQAPVFKKGGKMKKMMGGNKMAQMKKNYMSK